MELRRKLPDYETLKRHYVAEGMSYADIAEKYDVRKQAVYMTLKRRAENRGEWPLKPSVAAQKKANRSKGRRLVKAALIVYLVNEYLADKAMTEGISMRQAMKAFCAEHRLSLAYLYEVRQMEYISRDYARKLLSAIGEPIDHTLYPSRYKRPERYAS